MKKHLTRRALILLALLMMASTASARSGQRDIALFLNSRESFSPSYAGASRAYTFTPDTGGLYVFRGFPAGSISAPIYARLYDAQGTLIGRSAGNGSFVLEAMLAEGEAVRLEVSSYSTQVTTRIEVMAQVHGRSFSQPIVLNSGSVAYNRAVVRPRDTHWYAYTPEADGWYIVRTETAGKSPLDTNGCVMDETGRMIAENDDVLFPSDGNFRICLYLSAGKQYYIRVSAVSNQTGSYRLIVAAPQGEGLLPARLMLDKASLTVEIGEQQALSARALPENAQNDLMWISEDSQIAQVDAQGVVSGVSAGETLVHVYAGQLEAVCRVTVPAMEATSLACSQGDMTLAVGETASVAVTALPAEASLSLSYESSDSAVVSVNSKGELSALAEGVAQLIVRDEISGLKAEMNIEVTAAHRHYRALVLGEQNYAGKRTRVGGLNTAQGIADMLREQSIDGEAYRVTLHMDVTREELLAAIEETFAEATEADLSLFYINCHGDYDGAAYLELHDGSRITASQLEMVLRRIPGKVVVIMDCCRSGGFLQDAGRFTGSVQAAFSQPSGPLTDNKYIVLTSAGPDQDSYRRSFAETDEEESMATIMARALCEGAGWDLINDRICTLKADANKDRRITLQEIYLYTSRRVMYYLEGTGVTQSVCVWPEGDQTVLFERSGHGG